MLSFPNCKINLGLHIVNKRNDGYHNLQTIFYPLPFTDALEMIPLPHNEMAANDDEGHSGFLHFSATGLPIHGESMNNLCVKAYHLLQQDFPELPAVQMHLHKAIPMGAGLGGGSADGAYVLMLLNSMFNLELSRAQLIHYSIQLGSDCAFFIINSPCFATGRGEIMEPVAINLSGYSFVLVNLGISINTGWAFSQINIDDEPAASSSRNFLETISGPVTSWKNALVNDFEKPVFEKYPEIKAIKNKLYDYGALYASMTGSGSTIYGIFKNEGLPDFDMPENYRIIKVRA